MKALVLWVNELPGLDAGARLVALRAFVAGTVLGVACGGLVGVGLGQAVRGAVSEEVSVERPPEMDASTVKSMLVGGDEREHDGSSEH